MKNVVLSITLILLLSSLVIAAQVNSQGNQNQATITSTNQIQNRITQGSYNLENGEKIQIQEKAQNKIQLKVRNISAHTVLNITQEQIQGKTKLKTQLSNGRNAEIKIMPDTASEIALQRLRLRVCNETYNCTIELKEVGNSGESKQAAYEVRAQKRFWFLGMFESKQEVKAQISAETGELIREEKPWWSWMATEEE